MTTPVPSPEPAKRSKRLYVYWGIALALLLALGLLSWLVVVPVWQTHRALSEQRYALLTVEKSPWGKTRWGQEEKETVELLGGRDQAVRRLLLYVRMPREIAPYRVEAVFLLARCAGKNAIPALTRHLQDTDSLVREQAAWALRKLGASALLPAVPALIGALEDKSAKVRGFAARTLGALGAEAKGAVPRLEALQSDRGIYVSCVDGSTMPIRVGEVAAVALKKIREEVNKERDSK